MGEVQKQMNKSQVYLISKNALCTIFNPEDTNVKLRAPVGRKEMLREKLLSGPRWKGFLKCL